MKNRLVAKSASDRPISPARPNHGPAKTKHGRQGRPRPKHATGRPFWLGWAVFSPAVFFGLQDHFFTTVDQLKREELQASIKRG